MSHNDVTQGKHRCDFLFVLMLQLKLDTRAFLHHSPARHNEDEAAALLFRYYYCPPSSSSTTQTALLQLS